MAEGSLLETTYEFLSKVTEGGMGAIYKVRHRHLGEIRIVKVLKPELLGNAEMVQRFAQEAQLITRLKHSNIAAIYDFVVEDDGMAYIVMEYVDGANLAQLLSRTGRLEIPLALDIASQVLEALSYLHKKKIVHRDVSANNVMLFVDEDGALQVKLIDMGLAKSLETVKAMTSTGVIMGNLFYASPEQVGNNVDGSPLDGRSDLYSLGAVLYEMATGTRPFEGKTPMDLVSAHAFKAPLTFEESDPERHVSEDLRQVISRALEKSASKRFPTAEAFRDALKPIRARQETPLDLSVVGEAIKTSRPKSSAANPSLEGWRASTPGRRSAIPGRRTPLPDVPSEDVVFPEAARSDEGSGARRPQRPGSTDKTRLVELRSSLTDSAVAPAAHRPLVLAGVALAGGLVAVLAVLLFRPNAPEAGKNAAGAGRPPKTVPAATSVPEPTATPSPAPTVLPATPAPPREDAASGTQRVRADLTRDYAIKARQRAERAGGGELPSFALAARLFREGESRLAAGHAADAATSFQKAADGFGEAESAAAEASRQKLVERANATAVPLPTRVVPAPPTPRPTEPPARPREEERPRTVSAEEKIRSVVSRYAAAQSTLDVDAYLALYPGLAAERRRIEDAYRNLRSQTLEIEVRKVDVEGDKATVHAQENRTYAPKVGSEGHGTRSVTIRLQQKGGDWIITKIE